jgi:hypothetical protein
MLFEINSAVVSFDAGHVGDWCSLNVVGSPLLTNESQKAVSSCEKARSIGSSGVKVVVPLNLAWIIIVLYCTTE